MNPRSRRAHRELPLAIDATPSTYAGVKSAVRMMQIFDLFDQLQRDASVNEIVEHLAFPQSSTSVLLKSLAQTGYIEYLPATRTYIPTPRVALLGSWISGSPIRDGNIGRMMDELGAETGEAIALACKSGIYAKYIHVVEATSLLRLHVSVGSQRFLAWSPMGVPLLSDMPDDEIRLLVKHTNAEAPSKQKAIDVKQALSHVEQYRKRGYFLSRGLVTPGAGMICMRLPLNSASHRPLALGIGALAETIDRQKPRLVRVMRNAIARYINTGLTKPATRDKW